MIIQGRVQFLPKEGAYVLGLLGWLSQPGNQIYERLSLNNLESHLDTGTYRPASDNWLGGIDWGWEAENDVNGPFPSKRKLTDIDPRYTILDPFKWFDPLYASTKSLEYARANPTAPFRPWAYGYPGAQRNSSTIGLVEMTALVGPVDKILNVANSPFWRMLNAGMNVDGMPKPPNVYYSRLPEPPMKVGPYLDGRANLLQRILQEDGRYIGTLDNYYGSKTKGDPPNTGGIMSVQRDFKSWEVWDRPIDGIYSVELHAIWDAMLEFDFYTRWS